ncbi:DUF1758 domain-containing protein [Trichonephila clavipes]|nr:DUF1758 domain-containing protein [Trichonephila clavipes]
MSNYFGFVCIAESNTSGAVKGGDRGGFLPEPLSQFPKGNCVKLNNVGLLARKNGFLEFRTEVKDILDSIISICEEKDEETYCTEKDDILDTLEEILVAINTQLIASVVNSDFEVKNQGSSQGLVSARSAEVKFPTL